MNRFSNINWAAFLWGGFFWTLWNRFYGWTAALFIAIVVVNAFGTTFSVTGIVVSSMISGLIQTAAAIYFALNGNRMLAERIDRKDLSSDEKFDAKFWTLGSQKRQVKGALVFIAVSYVAIMILTDMWIYDFNVLLDTIGVLVPLAVTLALLLILASIFYSGRDDLFQSDEAKHSSESTSELLASEGRVSKLLRGNRSKAPWIFASVILVLMFAAIAIPLFLQEQEVRTIRAREEAILATDADLAIRPVIAGEYRTVAEYVGSSGTHFRSSETSIVHYALNDDFTFALTLDSGDIWRGVFTAEEIEPEAIENVVSRADQRNMKFLNDRIGADWYHLALFEDISFTPVGDLFISIADDDIIFYLVLWQITTAVVERVQ